jgi:AcrR family transcriptional regulator
VPTQTERTDATTARLLDAARRLFGEVGYAQTSTEDIVAATGLTRGALYHHFGNKEGLFAAVFEREEQRLAQLVMEAADKLVKPRDRIKAGCKAFLEECLTPEFQRIALTDAPAVLGYDRVREVEAAYTMLMLSHSLEVATKGRKSKGEIEARTTLLFGALCEAGYFIGRAEKPRAAIDAIWTELETLIDALLKV